MPIVDFATAAQLGAALIGVAIIGALIWRARSQQRKWDALNARIAKAVETRRKAIGAELRKRYLPIPPRNK